MIDQSTVDTLKTLKLSAMAEELASQMQNASSYNQLGFEERLGLLVDAEWNRRQSVKLKRYIRSAGFILPGATIEGIEYYEDRKLDKAELLRFATCKYIDEGHHIILKGASGNGKSYIACALGNAACRKFKSVRYIRMPEMLDELSIAKSSGSFKKVINAYQKVDLLILDEWLIRCLTPDESYDLLEIVEARCRRNYNGDTSPGSHGSTIFCTQYETEGWYRRINPDPDSDSPISEAIMDRIVHNAFQVLIDGKLSMRERHSLKI